MIVLWTIFKLIFYEKILFSLNENDVSLNKNPKFEFEEDINQKCNNSYQIGKFPEANYRGSALTLKDFNFTHVGEENSTMNKNLICQIEHPILGHMAHFAQYVWPCFSLFQNFVEDERVNNFFIFMDQKYFKELKAYSLVLKSIIEAENNVTFITSLDQVSSVRDYTVAKLNYIPGSAWHGVTYRWFMTTADVSTFQKRVLGESFHSNTVENDAFRLLLLDRKDDNRAFKNANSIVSELHHHQIQSNYSLLTSIEYVSNFKYKSFKEQSKYMYSADIIISSHGAQLTNLAFIRPCTAVIEIFPKNYYVLFYQSLTLIAGGIHYDGFPSGFIPQESVPSYQERSYARNHDVFVDPTCILGKLMQIKKDILICRKNLLFNTTSTAS